MRRFDSDPRLQLPRFGLVRPRWGKIGLIWAGGYVKKYVKKYPVQFSLPSCSASARAI
jgi:hypothetical protein